MPTSTHRSIVVIPARWGSTRFPGKPLHPIAGKPLVRHVWERCLNCQQIDQIVVATDDKRIADACEDFGAKVVMTEADHPSGTDRVAEAASKFPDHDVIINVQGDEPLISPDLIDRLAVVLMNEPQLEMITAAAPITEDHLSLDPNVVKVVLNHAGNALYFSRSPLPFVRNPENGFPMLRHLGIYGFQRDFLFQFVQWPSAALERIEGLEQLRALANGASIRVLITDDLSPGVDTIEQANEIERYLHNLP